MKRNNKLHIKLNTDLNIGLWVMKIDKVYRTTILGLCTGYILANIGHFSVKYCSNIEIIDYVHIAPILSKTIFPFHH